MPHVCTNLKVRNYLCMAHLESVTTQKNISVYLQQNCVTLSNFFASMNLLYKFGFLLCKYHRLIKTYAMFYDKWLCTEILLKFFTMKKWLSAKVFSHT